MTFFAATALLIGVIAMLWISGMRKPADLKRVRGLPLFSLTLVPLIAFGVYFFVGTPSALQANASKQIHDGHAGSLDQLAAGLAAKLAANPDDMQGWKLLASTYEYLGRREEAREAQARADRIEGAHDENQAIETLRARLNKNPRDAEGWALLGRSYQSLRRFDLAADAFSHATDLQPADAALWADRADAQAAAHGGRLASVAKFIEKALRLDPDEPKALWLAGTLALEQNDQAKALAIWRKLETTLPPDDPQREIILGNIAELSHGVKPAPATQIRGKVSLAPAIAAHVQPGDTLFVFARASDSPMPIAAWRTPASGFPRAFTLDEATLLSPERSFAGVDPLIVGARISHSGNAAPAPGDWEATPSTVGRETPGEVALVIDHQVK